MNRKPIKQIISEVHELFSERKMWTKGNLYNTGCFCLLGAIAVSEGIVTPQEFQAAEEAESRKIGPYDDQQEIYDALSHSTAVKTLARYIANADGSYYKNYTDLTFVVYAFNDGTDIINHNDDVAYDRTMTMLESFIKTL